AVGGVDEVDAAFERGVDDPARRVEVDAAAEIVAAEPDHGHVERGTAEPAHLHDRFTPRRFRPDPIWPRGRSRRTPTGRAAHPRSAPDRASCRGSRARTR